jgi:excisionase family DNA binding protein
MRFAENENMERQKQHSNDTQRDAVYQNVEELAAALGLSRGVTYRELRAGRIPAIRIGPRRFIIPRSAITEWLKSAGGRPSLPQILT